MFAHRFPESPPRKGISRSPSKGVSSSRIRGGMTCRLRRATRQDTSSDLPRSVIDISSRQRRHARHDYPYILQRTRRPAAPGQIVHPREIVVPFVPLAPGLRRQRAREPRKLQLTNFNRRREKRLKASTMRWYDELSNREATKVIDRLPHLPQITGRRYHGKFFLAGDGIFARR